MVDAIEVGMKLHAIYKADGEYYPAEVVDVSDAKKRAKAPVKVHYKGEDEEYDAWVPVESLKSKKLPKSAIGAAPATLKATAKAKDKAKAGAEPKYKEKKERPARKPVTLTYFNIEGKAEKIRLAMKIGKVAFEDKRVSFPEWGELKSTMKYGQMPVMQVGDGEPLAQSGAMLRCCGKWARLYPQSLATKIEEVIGLEEDIEKALGPSLYIGMKPQLYGYEDVSSEERTKIQLKLREKLVAPDGDLVRMLGYLEALLSDESPFMCGKSVTIADCQVIARLRHLKKGVLDGVPASILDGFPKLLAYFDLFHAIPEVKEYYESLAK